MGSRRLETACVSTRHILYLIFKSFRDAIFPNACYACGSFFQSVKDGHEDGRAITDLLDDKNGFFQSLMSPYLCQDCLPDYAPVEPPFCTMCGIMFKSREGDSHVCGNCLSTQKPYISARAAGIYDLSLLSLIHRLKYNEKAWLAKPLGRLLFAYFMAYYGKDTIDVVMPVPLHIKRFRKRGFNQAYLLIKDWMKIAGEYHTDLSVTIDRDSLARTKQTESQTGLGRKARLTNIKNAFSVKYPERIKDKNILLVDDVYTTGATVGECAKALLRSGAAGVSVLTLARAM